MTTKGQIEAKISEIVTKFEVETMGRGPQEINTIINKDMIFIRQRGFLSPAEKKLAEDKNGIEIIKRFRSMLFENETKYFKKIIKEIINAEVISLHSDVSTKTGEKIIVITVNKNLEKLYK